MRDNRSITKQSLEMPDYSTGFEGGENGEKDGKNFIIVQAQSAGYNGGNFAKIMINNTPVEVAKNESNHFRGLHIVVIEPNTGNVLVAQAFDTYKNSTGLNEFTQRVVGQNKDIPEGHIIVAACQDDCTTALSDEAKNWFEDMGASEITNVGYREGYAFIGTVPDFGKQKHGEKLNNEVTEKRSEIKSGVATVTHMF